MFYLIGAGLADANDISVKGLNAIKKCSEVYLEGYTNMLQVSVERLEADWGVKVKVVARGFVEQHFEKDVLPKGNSEDVALVIIGDALSATTHTALLLEAKKQGIDFQVIHNASVLTAVGVTGLELYKFGYTVSLPYPEHDVLPKSAYERLKTNMDAGMHTLLLLDIKADEKRYMSIKEAIELLERMGLSKETLGVGCARLGSESEKIVSGKLSELETVDFGKPVHCLIIPGKLHFMEEEMIESYKAKP